MHHISRLNCVDALVLIQPPVCTNSGVASSISEGGIFIYLCSAQLISFENNLILCICVVNLISKEINCVEHEYMNMCPGSLIALAMPLCTKHRIIL